MLDLCNTCNAALPLSSGRQKSDFLVVCAPELAFMLHSMGTKQQFEKVK